MKNTLTILGLFLSATILLAGCASQNNGDNPMNEQANANPGMVAQQDEANPDAQKSGPAENQNPAVRGLRQNRIRGAGFTQACDGKTAEDTCTVTMRNETVEGKCMDRDGILSCMLNPGLNPGRGPAPNMDTVFAEACKDKSEGDACTLTLRNRTIDGTCTSRNENLECMPKDRINAQRAGAGPAGPDPPTPENT